MIIPLKLKVTFEDVSKKLCSIFRLPKTLDLTNAFNSLNINVTIVGIRWKDQCKDQIDKPTRIFMNFILIKIILNEKSYKIKLFKDQAMIAPVYFQNESREVMNLILQHVN